MSVRSVCRARGSFIIYFINEISLGFEPWSRIPSVVFRILTMNAEKELIGYVQARKADAS